MNKCFVEYFIFYIWVIFVNAYEGNKQLHLDGCSETRWRLGLIFLKFWPY
jgi:hypothetical protein